MGKGNRNRLNKKNAAVSATQMFTDKIRNHDKLLYKGEGFIPSDAKIVKIGETTDLLRRESEHRRRFQQARLKLKKIGPLHWTNKYGKKVATDDNGYMSLLEEYGYFRLKESALPSGVPYSREFFYDLDDAIIQQVYDELSRRAYEMDPRTKWFVSQSKPAKKQKKHITLREGQRRLVQSYLGKVAGGCTKMLIAAYTRFGKCVATMAAIQEEGRKFALIVAGTNVANEWCDTVEVIDNFNDWKFFTSKGLGANPTILRDCYKADPNARVAVFLTLQDIQGDKIKPQHKEILNYIKKPDSVLIVDETHDGGNAPEYSKKFADAVSVFKAPVELHISATPFKLLNEGEFKLDDIVFMETYDEMLTKKHALEALHGVDDHEHNPYWEFPDKIAIGYELTEVASEVFRKLHYQGVNAYAELFRVDNTTGKFLYEKELVSFLQLLDGTKNDNLFLSVLGNAEIMEKMGTFHALLRVNQCNEVDALVELFINHKTDFETLGEYDIIPATGKYVKHLDAKTLQQRVHADEIAGRPSLTITCERFIEGITVKEWNMTINASTSSSAQDNAQFDGRHCSPRTSTYVAADGSIIERNDKPTVLSIDLCPERMLKVLEDENTVLAIRDGETNIISLRNKIAASLTAVPMFIVGNAKNAIKPVTPTSVMDVIMERSKGVSSIVDNVKIPKKVFSGSDEAISAIMSMESVTSQKGSIVVEASSYEGELDFQDTAELEKLLEELSNKEPETVDDNDEKASVHSEKNTASAADEDDFAEKFTNFKIRSAIFTMLAEQKIETLGEFIKAAYANAELFQHVVGLVIDSLIAVLAELKNDKRSAFEFEKMLYKMSHYIVDDSLSYDDKLNAIEMEFSRLSPNDVNLPADVADDMVRKAITKEELGKIISGNKKVLDFCGETVEITRAVIRYAEECGYEVAQLVSVLYAFPANPVAAEIEKWAYEKLGLDPAHVSVDFTAADISVKLKDDKENASALLKRLCQVDKTFRDIRADDELAKDTKMALFDYVIGNPPYQLDTDNGNERKPPIYHCFMDAAAAISERTVLITPGRFLSDSGQTPKEWNRKMLKDPHFKVLKFEPNSARVFPSVDIKGGIAITMIDRNATYEPVNLFIPFTELRSIREKIGNVASFNEIAYPFTYFDLTTLFKEHPECKKEVNKGKDKLLRTNTFDKVSVFHNEKEENDLLIYGISKLKRTSRYINRNYILDFANRDKFKVLIPKSNGSGALGEKISTPLVGEPLVGYTQSFISFGAFDTREEAEHCMAYIKTKFCRVMLGILKTTQDNPPEKWQYVPLQDFTAASDIDWFKSVPEIDQQLYAKYELTQEEIDFIENHVTAME